MIFTLLACLLGLAGASCVGSTQPPFTSQCKANVLLHLDYSGSISGNNGYCGTGSGQRSCQPIRDAVKSFAQSLFQVSQLGGEAYLGLVVFATGATVEFPMTRLTQTFVNDFSAWIDANYLVANGGYTNWPDSLYLGRTYGFSPVPDIVVVFTDGVPTITGPLASSSCSPLCTNTAGEQACLQANLIKQEQNCKIFVIGVGDIASDLTNLKRISGPVAWDRDPATFKDADYVVDADFATIGTLFAAVAQGLCPCLQDQLCDGPACQTQFTAKFRITEPPIGLLFGNAAVTKGYIYFNFAQSLQRVAFEIFDPSADFTAIARQTIVREDIVDPCKTIRQVSCQSSCTSLRTKNSLPRLFHHSTDCAGIKGGDPYTDCSTQPTIAKYNPTGTACQEIYTHSLLPGASPLQIRYIWGKQVSGQYVICAAESIDGTLWEFFDNSGTTYGAINGVPVIMPTTGAYTIAPNNGVCDNTETSNPATCNVSSPPTSCQVTDCPKFWSTTDSGFYCTGTGSTTSLPTCTNTGLSPPANLDGSAFTLSTNTPTQTSYRWGVDTNSNKPASLSENRALSFQVNIKYILEIGIAWNGAPTSLSGTWNKWFLQVQVVGTGTWQDVADGNTGSPNWMMASTPHLYPGGDGSNVATDNFQTSRPSGFGLSRYEGKSWNAWNSGGKSASYGVSKGFTEFRWIIKAINVPSTATQNYRFRVVAPGTGSRTPLKYVEYGIAARVQKDWCASTAQPCGGPVPVATRYNFNKLGASCTGGTTCKEAVELVVLVDEQSSISATAWTNNWKPFVITTLKGFDPSIVATRFQLSFPNGNGSPWTKVAHHPDSTGAQLNPDVNTEINTLNSRPKANGNTDFAQAIHSAIRQYWPTAPNPTDPPRNLLVMVGGPDSPNTGDLIDYPDVNVLKAQRGVKVWAYGIGAGATQTALMAKIADSSLFQLVALTDAELDYQSGLIWGKICPGLEKLCPNCGGFCQCNNLCVCPTCSSDPCNVASCSKTTPQIGCVATKTTCFAGDTCNKPSACSRDDKTGNAVCQASVPVDCKDARFCTYDTCVLGVGCVNNPLSGQVLLDACDDKNSCTDDSCDAVADACKHTTIPYSLENPTCNPPCQSLTTCVAADKCEDAKCIQDKSTPTTSPFGCDDIPAGQARTDCLAKFDVLVPPAQQAYCYRTTQACGTNACGKFSCDPNVGGCGVFTATVTCSDSLACTDDSCDSKIGCVYTPKAGAALTAFCDDKLACTKDTCVGSACVFTPITTGSCACPACVAGASYCNLKDCILLPSDCNSVDLAVKNTCINDVNDVNKGFYCWVRPRTCNHINCFTEKCNDQAGQCVYTAVSCDDSNDCTKDSCQSDACVYTPLTAPEQATLCDDGIACNVDECVAATQTKCTHTDPSSKCATEACYNGGNNPCTAKNCFDAFCRASSCLAGSNPCTKITIGAPPTDVYCEYIATKCTGDGCGTKKCDANSNKCVYDVLTVCDDQDSCTADSCVNGACLYSPKLVSSVCDDKNECTTDACTSSKCAFTPITTGRCACLSGACGTRAPCQFLDCIYQGHPSLTCADTGASQTDCNNDLANLGKQYYCWARDRPACPAQACRDPFCNLATDQCEYPLRVCDDGDSCTVDECSEVPTSNYDQCVFTPISGGALSSKCPVANNDPCIASSCVNSACVFTPITTGACATPPCDKHPCSAPPACKFSKCYQTNAACDADSAILDAAVCKSNIMNSAEKRHCGTIDRVCPIADNVCVKYDCDCKQTPTVCTSPDNCHTANCVVASGGCVYTPIACENGNKCENLKCVSQAVGYKCVKVDDVTCNDNKDCTTDVCETTRGCVYTPVPCYATGGAEGCNVTRGCYEVNNAFNYPPGCVEQLIQSLIDFCGKCKGDNIGCFFSSVDTVGSSVGIAAGVVVAIVIAVIIGLLIAAFLSRKGYLYYKSKSDLSSTGAHTNPYFVANTNAGSMPTGNM